MYPQLSLYIDGQFLHGEGRREQDVLNPATNQVIGLLPHATQSDLDLALTSAERAFVSWRNSSAMQRAEVLHKVAGLIRERVSDIGRNLTLEQGKPLAESRTEIAYAASFIEWFAEEGKRVYGDVIAPPADDRRVVVIKQPIGPSF